MVNGGTAEAAEWLVASPVRRGGGEKKGSASFPTSEPYFLAARSKKSSTSKEVSYRYGI
jgi:hypothetical protein